MITELLKEAVINYQTVVTDIDVTRIIIECILYLFEFVKRYKPLFN